MNETRAQELNVLAAAVAKILGGSVTRESDGDNWWNVKIVTGAGLPLHVTHSDKRLTVSVDLPGIRDRKGYTNAQSRRDLLTYEERKGAEPVTEISVSAERSAEVIARDITRRLIPGATELYRRACERRDCAEAHERGTAETLATLAKRLGVETRKDSDCLYPGGIDLHVSGPNSIRVEHLSVSVDVAVRLVEMIRAEKVDE